MSDYLQVGYPIKKMDLFHCKLTVQKMQFVANKSKQSCKNQNKGTIFEMISPKKHGRGQRHRNS